MARFPFIGPSYESQSPNAATEQTINFYPEKIESNGGKASVVLYPTPGMRAFCTLPASPVRGLFYMNGRMFAVGGGVLYEVDSLGTVTSRGLVSGTTSLVQMCSNGDAGGQLFITSNDVGYILTLATNVLTTPLVSGAKYGRFVDSYFLALNTATSTLRMSNRLDGTTWSGGSVAQRSTAADRLSSMIVSHRELWLFGEQTSEVWYNSGATFPFEPIPGAFIEQGIAAPDSAAVMDNTVFWLGRNKTGSLMVWRAQGYTPMRVSNHAIEYAISNYSTVDDAQGWTYADQGHMFYVLSFPTAGVTWVYDAATNLWHQRGWWNKALSRFQAYRPQAHCYAFGKNLVGDSQTGVIYELDVDVAVDVDGADLRRVRQAPHLCNEQKWMFYNRAQLDLETGLGTAVDPGADPQVMLQWSDDGGHTWSNEHWASAGPRGKYRQRVIWNRLGRSRDRVLRVVMTDPVPWRLIDLYVDLEAGTH